MAVGVGAAVISFIGGSAGAAFAATAVGAVVSGIVGGAIVGAAIGGLTAAVTGGDIGKGLLFGAVGGAVAGGISGYVGGAAGGSVSGTVTTGAVEAGTGAIAQTAPAIEAGTGAIASTGAGTAGAELGWAEAAGTLMDKGATQGAMQMVGKGIEGYAKQEMQEDLLKAQRREAELNRAHDLEKIKLSANLGRGGGASDSALLSYKLGMSQLGENIRQFDVQREDYLKNRAVASKALGAFKLEKKTGRPATAPKSAFDTSVAEPEIA